MTGRVVKLAGQAQFIPVLLRNRIAGSAEGTDGRRTIDYREWSITGNTLQRRDHVIVTLKEGRLQKASDSTADLNC